ncbi:MAG: hypothetical protein U0V72_01125 [Cytophagales bacterium]
MEISYEENCNTLINNYLEEVEFLIKAQKYQLSFLLLSQIIEFLGSLIDDKPLRAKDQSKKRFSLALKKLFKAEYHKANDKDFLYYQYRCNMSHLLSGSANILLTNSEKTPKILHLKTNNNKLLLVIEPLFEDTQLACQKFMFKLKNNEYKAKKGLNTFD